MNDKEYEWIEQLREGIVKLCDVNKRLLNDMGELKKKVEILEKENNDIWKIISELE